MKLLYSVLRVAETIKIKCNVIKLRTQLKCESVLGKAASLCYRSLFVPVMKSWINTSQLPVLFSRLMLRTCHRNSRWVDWMGSLISTW